MNYDYNNEEEENLEYDDSFVGKILSMDKKKIAIILLILLILLFEEMGLRDDNS